MRTIYLLSVLAVSGAATVGIWQLQEFFIGTPPTTVFSPDAHGGGSGALSYSDPDIDRLKQMTEARPDNVLAWKALGNGILKKMGSGVIPREAGSIEAITAFRKVLDLNPNDIESLLSIADVSYEMRAFVKAEEFYQQYIEKVPGDVSATARYASTLIFLGKEDLARAVLSDIQPHPDDFRTHAFITLSYAQLKDEEQIKKWGEKSLALAPHEEARMRLKTFIQGSLQETPESPTLEGYLRAHHIVGQKIVQVKGQDDTLIVTVREFPMSAMPPFAREKFEQGIRTFVSNGAVQNPYRAIKFVDDQTGNELGEVLLEVVKDK